LRHEDVSMADRLSAELDARFNAGPLTQVPIVRVRDLLVCAGDPSIDVPVEEVYAHPPIGWVIEELDRDTAELVMNAGTPRSHYFVPVCHFGQPYSFGKEVPLDDAHPDLPPRP
jgi:hypothetical protein